MPVDDINTTNPVLPTALQGRTQTAVPIATSSLNLVQKPVAVATAASENLTPSQQVSLLGSEAVQTLHLEPTSPAEPLLATQTTPNLTTTTESQGLTPAQQAALAVNETVQTAIAAENLSPAQQAALAASQATQTLTAPLTETETTITTTTAGITGQAPTTGVVASTVGAGTTAGGETTEVTPAATTTTTTAVPTTETTSAGIALTPAQQAAAQAIPYRNALAVYEVRNPTPPPGEPLPTRKDLHPPLPIGRVRPVDPLVLRKEWEKRKKAKRKESGPGDEAESRPPLAEKAIRDLVHQANEDLLASGVPLQLVLVKNEEGFALDVYDCSDEAVCAVEQEIPLDFNNLLTILDNIEHEAGIIVNIKT